MQNADLTKKAQHYKTLKTLFSYVKMGKEILTFGNIAIEKILNLKILSS